MKLVLGYKSVFPALFVVVLTVSMTSMSFKGNAKWNLFSLTYREGQLSNLKNIEDNVTDDWKLKISDKSADVTVNKYLQQDLSELRIDSNLEKGLVVGTQFKDDKQSTGLVDNLHFQVGLEAGAFDVGQDTVKKYTANTVGLEKYKKSFQEGLITVQQFQDRQKNPGANRKSRTTKKEKALVLTKPMREAIKKFYETFDKLSAEEKALFTKLNQISRESEKSKNTFSAKHKLSDILKALQRIGWENKKVELVSRNLDNKRFKPSLENWYGWGSWESSPWKYFFTSAEDWKNKISNVEKSKNDLESYLKRKRGCLAAIVFGRWAVESCYTEKSKYSKKIEGAEEAISMHIADWMLKQMNLLN